MAVEIMTPSKRSDIQPFLVMQALREAAVLEEKGEQVLHLSLGQPANRAPQRVLDKVAEALKSEQLGYTDARGIAPLRERLSAFYKECYGLEIPAERFFITTGSSSAQFLALLAGFDVGQTVAINTPCYAAYPQLMRALGLKPVFLPCDAGTNYQPTRAMLEALPEKPDGIVITSPSNPTGTVIEPKEFEAIIAYCNAQGIKVISDEIYHKIAFDDAPIKSALEYSDDAIVTSSFSKYFLLPGWRLGWMIVPESFQSAIENVLMNFFLSAPAVAQIAALEVFNCTDELDAVVAGYAKNREILMERFPQIGFDKISNPQGAFYLYVDVSDYTDDSLAFARDMLHATGVCAVSGVDFDAERGHHFLRFSYAGSPQTMLESCERLSPYLSQLKEKKRA